MEILAKFYTPGIVFMFTLAFGFWVSYAGRPYNGILFNIHKLIALAAVIMTASQIYKLVRNSEPQAMLIVLLIVAALCIVALFASGAFLSIGNLNYKTMKLIHNIFPVVTVLAVGSIIYLLSMGRL